MTRGEGYRDLHIELTWMELFDTNIRIKLANLVELSSMNASFSTKTCDIPNVMNMDIFFSSIFVRKKIGNRSQYTRFTFHLGL